MNGMGWDGKNFRVVLSGSLQSISAYQYWLQKFLKNRISTKIKHKYGKVYCIKYQSPITAIVTEYLNFLIFYIYSLYQKPFFHDNKKDFLADSVHIPHRCKRLPMYLLKTDIFLKKIWRMQTFNAFPHKLKDMFTVLGPKTWPF